MTDVCFWCKRGIRGEGDPVYRDYNFCPMCRRIGDLGITIIQVSTTDNGNLPVGEDNNIYPTGRWVVVSVDEAKKVLTGHPLYDSILEIKKMYVNEEDWVKLNLP